MAKAGLIASTILVAGFAVGLGFSCYHQGLNQDARDMVNSMIKNNYKIESAHIYRNASDSLDTAASNMGDIIVNDNQILVINRPDKDTAYENLEDALEEVLSSRESTQYTDQIMDLSKDLLLLDDIDKDAEKYKQVEIDIRLLANELENNSYKLEPNIDGIAKMRNSYSNRVIGCGVGIAGASIGIICCGIWMGYMANDVKNDMFYNRKNNKKVRNKI